MTKTHGAKHSIHEIKANLCVLWEKVYVVKKQKVFFLISALYSQEY